jgi:tRNA pseudouridine38-40 synthase
LTRTFKLTIAYDGTDFVGWQVQPNGPSIQAALANAIKQFTGETVKVIGSGRTDAGVHAIAQVASVQIDSWNQPAGELRRAINRFLPDSVVVRGVEDAPDGFHAIRDCISKRYRYQLLLGRVRDPFSHRYCWHLGYKMDLETMQSAADKLIGKKDFACFQATGAPRSSTVRDVRVCELIRRDSPTSESLRLDLEIEADGFLYNMVRNIVGSLVDVARGRQTEHWIDALIETGDRKLAGQTAPAKGLFMIRADYEEDSAKS